MQDKKWPLASKPDWSHWGQMETVSLAEAVVLSFDQTPVDGYIHSPAGIFSAQFYPDDPRVAPLRNRYMIALSSFTQPNFPKVEQLYQPGVPKRLYVNLPKFGSWAKSKGFDLPTKFPCTEDKIPHKRRGGISIDLPYECPFMAILADIMWENFHEIDPNHPPKQLNVAIEISNLLKINKRTATTLASKIKPSNDPKRSVENDVNKPNRVE